MDELERVAEQLRRWIEETHADCPVFREFCLRLLEQEVERVPEGYPTLIACRQLTRYQPHQDARAAPRNHFEAQALGRR